jgi:DNA-directed RNA polymerase subunit RPC12/RpoP
MSRTQRFFTRFAGAETAAAMEAHSRAWLVQCPHCGFERSIWELGGIRYKAAGNPRMLGTCPNCGRRGWHKVHKAANFPATAVPAWPLVRLILAVVLAAFLVVGMLVALVLKLTGAI